ncbi:GGDEF domain-containing protein [Halopseudomonas sp.]|uniref:GGDEF domain-containing protein n=1 Tax=Halopseudomonas sp. TaxID=2901191 RepID=UPI0030031212
MMHVQGNTIDFDTARLKLDQSTKSASTRRKLAKQGSQFETVQRQLLHNLQTTLEVGQVLSLFHKGLQELLQVDALEYKNNADPSPIQVGQPALHRCSYRISHAGNYLGELQFSRQQRFAENELLAIETLLGTLLFPLRNALMYREALRDALNDSLTGTSNRLALNQNLERDIRQSHRSQQPLSLLVLDIDHFKQVNDRYGHAYGDAALKAVANCVTESLRSVDGLYRLGGEEFVVLLNSTSLGAGRMVAERIRKSVENMQFELDGQPIPLTVSLGLATLRAEDNASSLINRGDQLMYDAKRQGRNRVCIEAAQ